MANKKSPAKLMEMNHGSIEAALKAGIKAGLTRRQIADLYGSTPSNIRNMAKRRKLMEYDDPIMPMPTKAKKGETAKKVEREVDDIDAIHIAVMSERIEHITPAHPMFRQVADEILAQRGLRT